MAPGDVAKSYLLLILKSRQYLWPDRKVSGNARTLQLPVKSVLEEPMLPYPINLFYKKFADFIRRFRQN